MNALGKRQLTSGIRTTMLLSSGSLVLACCRRCGITIPLAGLPVRGKCTHRRTSGQQQLQVLAKQSLDYKQAGVDIDAGAELVKRIQKMNPSIGGFSGLVPFGEE